MASWRFPDLPPSSQAWLEKLLGATFEQLEGKSLTVAQLELLKGAYEMEQWLAAYKRGAEV